MNRSLAVLATSWAVTLCLWLLAVTGRGAPTPIARGAVALSVVGTLGVGALWVGRAIQRAVTSRNPALLLAPCLLVLALAVRLVGLDHEVGELFYEDEGIYSHHAARVNAGELLQRNFVYPHLLYYLDALVIWMGTLFQEVVSRSAASLYGLEDWLAVRRLLMRLVVALMGAATVLPVFAVGRRLAGTAAGVMGALLIVFSPLYNDGSHLAICDVPSAFFAALCLAATARLLDGEEARWYALAGAAAGLAAAAKYPAGMVAVAPAAVWLRWRLRERRFRPGLFQAGLAALALFLATNPALVAYPREALVGSRGILFGASLYGGEGWLGVVPESAPLWYSRQLAWGFGWPALGVGLAGLVLLSSTSRRRLAWLLPFPVLYLGTVFSMTIAVARTLYPVLPPLAAFLGVGATAAARRLCRGSPGFGHSAAALLACAVLAVPVIRTVQQDIGLARPGTRVVAREWIREHVPRGVSLLREAYTPDFSPAEYDDEGLGGTRFLAALPMEEIRRPGVDFVLVSSGAFQRFFRTGESLEPVEWEIRERYRAVFETFPLVARFPPGPTRLGPELRLYRVVPDPVPWRTRRRFRPEELFVPDGGMRGPKGESILFTRPGQWTLAKEYFERGTYRLRLEGESTGAGIVTVLGTAGEGRSRVPLASSSTTIRLRRRGKYLFYVALATGSLVRGVEIHRRPSDAEAEDRRIEEPSP